MKQDLERIEVPGAEAARARAWTVVRAAFAERQVVARPSRIVRPLVVLAFVAALAAAALSPPGRAVIDELREVVGVRRAQPALFSLPAEGRLLVTAESGVWIVHGDGAKRRLGAYREASWSPFGRFVVAAGENELAALEPDGDVRWTLSRRGARSPRWTGSETDTEIAYLDRSGLRLVAGDGTGDRVVREGSVGAIAWRPGPGRVLALASSHEVRVLDVETGRTLWRVPRRPAALVTKIEWSSDGGRLLVLSPRRLEVYDSRGRVVDRNDPADGWPNVDASFRPGSAEVAVVRVHGSESTVFNLAGLVYINGSGEFRDVEWSPDGRWLVVGWATADQWVFVRKRPGGKRIRGVADVSAQLRSRSFPRIESWCCVR